jgi:hypothetical protein
LFKGTPRAVPDSIINYLGYPLGKFVGLKHRHQLPHSSDAKMIHLVPTDRVRETSSRTSSAKDSKFTTHHKPTWEPLLPP